MIYHNLNRQMTLGYVDVLDYGKSIQDCYRCLQNNRPLQHHTLRLSNPFPPKFNVDEVNSGSGSACKINT